MVEACKDIYSLSRIRAGNPYVIITDAEGLHRFEYEIDSEQKLVISRTHDSYEACLEAIAYDVRLELVAFTIDSNMFQAVADVGEGPSLAIALADVFGWEVDFIRSIREGDSFQVLVEKRYQEGEFKRYGPVLAAKFVNQGKEFEAFYYEETDGASFFTRNGDSMKRAFLKAPLSFTRISSGYNLRRLHPIFKEVRPHPAIDYAAPAGTPVKAIGSGVISFVGWGKGAGKHIVIKHPNDYESIYMHLSGYAKGITKGTRVQQGQVIGYVGSTGYATGPHLDFRIKHKGQYINPATVTSPRSEPVSKENMADFTAHVERCLAWLDGSKPLSDYPLADLLEEELSLDGGMPGSGQGNATQSANATEPAAAVNATRGNPDELDTIVIDGTGPAEH